MTPDTDKLREADALLIGMGALDEARAVRSLQAERDRARASYADAEMRCEAAEAERNRLLAFVQRARPLLGMSVPGSLGAEADDLLAGVPEETEERETVSELFSRPFPDV